MTGLAQFHGILDYYDYGSPTNYEQEKDEFFAHLKKNKIYNPQFTYQRLPLSLYLEIQNIIQKTDSKDPIIQWFQKTYLRACDLMIALIKKDYKTVTHISDKIYGDSSLLDIEKTQKAYLDATQKLSQTPKKVISPSQIQKLSEKYFKTKNLHNRKIVRTDEIPWEAIIKEKLQTIFLKKDYPFDALMIQRMLFHEIQGHAFQYLNWLSSDYQELLSGYLLTETQYEGFAIFTEINMGDTALIDYLLQRYLLLMIASHIAHKSSFYDTYLQIKNLNNNPKEAFMFAYRAKMWFQDTSKNGTLATDNAYLLGLYHIIHLHAQNPENTKKLHMGCFPLDQIHNHKTPDEIEYLSIPHTKQKNINYAKKALTPLLKKAYTQRANQIS